MVPSVSAYTRFCDGVASSFAAARNWVKVVAVSIRSSASMVRLGCSPVQASETPYASLPSPAAADPTWRRSLLASDSSGPCRELRTVIVRGVSSPATLISSVRTVSGW